MVHERMLEHVARAIGNERTIGDGVFAAGVFGIWFFADIEHTLVFLCAEQFEQFREVVFLPGLSQPLDLPESVWLDLKLNGVVGCVFHQCVARLEFEITGNITNADQHGSTESVSLPISEH